MKRRKRPWLSANHPSREINGGRYDGYSIRKTDNGYVFIEGYPDSFNRNFLTTQEYRNFNACLERRGINRLRS
jgi:hypothetical protein